MLHEPNLILAGLRCVIPTPSSCQPNHSPALFSFIEFASRKATCDARLPRHPDSGSHAHSARALPRIRKTRWDEQAEWMDYWGDVGTRGQDQYWAA